MEEIWHDSPELFLEALQALEKNFPGTKASVSLAEAMKADMHLPSQHARTMGTMLEAARARITKEEHVAPEPVDVQAAVAALNASVRVNYCYDLDWLAGYAEDDPTHMYIDRGFARRELAPYLVVHEVIEKSLLDYAHFERGYAYAHQLAQRVEEIAVEASGMTWEAYQRGAMEKEIDRVTHKKSVAVPPDLDLTPYRDRHDPKLPHIEALKAAMPCSVERFGHAIYHLTFKEPGVMAHTMMRFQEFYESPAFRGKYFTREEFMSWYNEEKKGTQYIEDWGLFGFNVPGEVLAPFNEGKFAGITAQEQFILDYFEPLRNENF